MKSPILSVALASLLLVPAAPFALAQHGHEGHGAPVVPEANPAERFEPDAALQEGMGRIHEALKALRHYEMGHMPESIAVGEVDEIRSAIDYLFAHCKLPANADAALHAILAPLLQAVQAFEDNPKNMAVIGAMRDAANEYPRRFNDPGWPSPAATAEHAGH